MDEQKASVRRRRRVEYERRLLSRATAYAGDQSLIVRMRRMTGVRYVATMPCYIPTKRVSYARQGATTMSVSNAGMLIKWRNHAALRH